MPGRSPGEGYLSTASLSTMKCLFPLPLLPTLSPQVTSHPQHTVHSNSKKQRVVLQPKW